MDRANIVVIGGGITGCSVAYHLARAGCTDVVLIDKGTLTSGSTCHAAGLVTQFNQSPAMMRFRRYSVELYRELGVFDTVGSVRFASSRESLLDLQRGAGRARAIGLDCEVISPAEALERLPAASPESLHGAVWMAGDGAVDPHTATYALADAARALGVTIIQGLRVTGIRLGSRREVVAVLTDTGAIETPCVVNAAGMWAPRVSAMVGAFTPSVPVDHQHVALEAVHGHALPHDTPCFRDPHNLIYGKAEAGGVLLGGYEPDPVSRWLDGVPWEHGSTTVAASEERFSIIMDGAIRRFPFLRDAGMVKLVCHPDAMTPDGNPLLGPTPGVPGFWTAAGLSLNGFGGAGGMGKTIAEWITTGETEIDVHSYRPWRFSDVYRHPGLTDAGGREVYRYYYRLRYPLDTDQWARPHRVSPLHGRLQELGAVFGVKNGWERPDYFEAGRSARRAGEDQRAFGWARPPYLDLVRAEHEAIRERVGILDMTSFGKIEVSGPDALALLERVSDNRIDRPVGAVVYTQFLNPRGGIVADVTVTRLAGDRFRVVTGAGAVASDLGWLRLGRRDEEDVTLRDATDELAVIGLWGPEARKVLSQVTSADVTHGAFGFATAETIAIGAASVLAQRITYVGELGWELYVAPDSAVQVWDRLMEAGKAYGIRPVGYRTLEGLRMEKGYRYFGTDLTAGDTPYAAALGFCVAAGTDGFIGCDALRSAAEPAVRIRTLLVGGSDYLTLYGGEAVYVDGELVARVRSAGYGFTVKRNIAYVYLPSGITDDAVIEVEVFERRERATLAPDVLHDPANARIRA